MSNYSHTNKLDSSPRKSSAFSSSLNQSALSPSSTSIKKQDNLKWKIEEITKQIQKLRDDRQSLDDDAKSNFIRKLKSKNSKKRPQTSNHPVHNTKEQIYNRTRMYHPHLEFVMAEVSMSPYLTDPLDKYPQATLKAIEKIRELRQSGIKYEEIPKTDLPFDYEKVRDTFVNEILKAQEFRKSEEFGRQPSIFSASAPGSVKKLASVAEGRKSADMASKIDDKAESFPIDHSQTKRPVKLRHQILEARKSTSAIESAFSKKSTVPVVSTEPLKKIASKETTRKHDEKKADKRISTAAKNASKSNCSALPNYSNTKEKSSITVNSTAEKPASQTIVASILTKEESTTSMEYKDDFHDESVHEGDAVSHSPSAPSSPIDSKPIEQQKSMERQSSQKSLGENSESGYSVESDHRGRHHAKSNTYTEKVITVSKKVSADASSTNQTKQATSPPKPTKAPSLQSSDVHLTTHEDENLAQVDEGMESSNDLILSRSISASGDFAFFGNTVNHPNTAVNLSEAIKASVSSPNKGKGVAEESGDDIGDISVTDEVTITWNNARNIRLQSISTTSHESVVEEINLSTLTSAKSSRSPSAKSLNENSAELPVSPLSPSFHDNHVSSTSGLKIGASYSSVTTTSSSSNGSTYHEPSSNKHGVSEKGHKAILTIIEESSASSPHSAKTSPRPVLDYTDRNNVIQPFSLEANMQPDASDIPTLDIVKTALFPEPEPSTSSKTSSSWGRSPTTGPPEQSFAAYDRAVGSSQRRLSIKVSATLLPVAEAVALAVNELDYKSPTSSTARSVGTSSLPTTRESVVQPIPEDEPKSTESSPTSIEAAFMNLDKLQGSQSERRLSSKSNSARGENSVDYSNLPSYMRPTASQSIAAANSGSGKSSRQASFRGNSGSRANSSSRLNISTPPEYISPMTMASPLSATSPSMGSPNTLSYSISMDANGHSLTSSPVKVKSSMENTQTIATAESLVDDNLPVEEQKSSKTISTPNSSTNAEKRTPISEVPFVIRSSNSAKFKNSSKSPARSPARTPTIRSPARSPAQSPNASKQSSPKANSSSDKRSAGNVVEFSPWADSVSPSRSNRKLVSDGSGADSGKLKISPKASESDKTKSPLSPAVKEDIPELSVNKTSSSNLQTQGEQSPEKSVRTPRTGGSENGHSKSVSIAASPSREYSNDDLPTLDRHRSFDHSSGYDSAYSPSDGTLTRGVSYLSRYSSRMTSHYDDNDHSEYYSNSTSPRSEIRPFTGKK